MVTKYFWHITPSLNGNMEANSKFLAHFLNTTGLMLPMKFTGLPRFSFLGRYFRETPYDRSTTDLFWKMQENKPICCSSTANIQQNKNSHRLKTAKPSTSVMPTN